MAFSEEHIILAKRIQTLSMEAKKALLKFLISIQGTGGNEGPLPSGQEKAEE